MHWHVAFCYKRTDVCLKRLLYCEYKSLTKACLQPYPNNYYPKNKRNCEIFLYLFFLDICMWSKKTNHSNYWEINFFWLNQKKKIFSFIDNFIVIIVLKWTYCIIEMDIINNESILKSMYNIVKNWENTECKDLVSIMKRMNK